MLFNQDAVEHTGGNQRRNISDMYREGAAAQAYIVVCVCGGQGAVIVLNLYLTRVTQHTTWRQRSGPRVTCHDSSFEF